MKIANSAFSVPGSAFGRRLVEEQYDAFLVDYGPDDYGEAELDEDENRLTVRNRFKAAAARRGLNLTFQRTNGNVLGFRVAPSAEAAPSAVESEPLPTPQPAPKGRGGRRKAATAPAGRDLTRSPGGG